VHQVLGEDEVRLVTARPGHPAQAREQLGALGAGHVVQAAAREDQIEGPGR